MPTTGLLQWYPLISVKSLLPIWRLVARRSIWWSPIFNSSPHYTSPLHPSAVYASVNWVSIGSDNGLSPVWRQAITWTNADFLSMGPLGVNLSEIWIKIQKFSIMKMPLKFSPAKWRPFWPGGDELSSLQWLHYLFFVHDDIIKWKHFLRYWPFVWEFTGLRRISRTKASDVELWCFLWSAPN